MKLFLYNPLMVLFDKSAFLDFPRFGIQIPALDSRKTKTMDALSGHMELAGRESEWLINNVSENTKLEDLVRVHSQDYSEGFFDQRAELRFKKAYELVNPDGSWNRWDPNQAVSPLKDMTPRLMKMQAGTYQSALIALDSGFCHYMGGGAHHGHRNFGHGFCPVNDTALAVRRLQSDGRVKRVWVIDLDAHKGDGTAAIFSEDDSVKTLSIHMARGWPLDGSLPVSHPSWTPSDIDIPVDNGEEDSYLNRLNEGLKTLIGSTAADFAIVLAGADPWEHDALPSTTVLNLSLAQLMERDVLTYQFLEEVGIPSAWLTAGGYGEESWKVHTQFLSWVLPRRL